MAVPLILQIDVDNRGQIKINQFNQSLNNVNQNINSSGKNFSHLSKILGGTVGAVFSLKGAFIGLGIGALARETLMIGTRFEQLQIALDTITKGHGVETFQALNEWALRMPINTEKAIQAFTQMSAMGLKPTIDQMTILVDTTSALGGAPETMMSIAEALGKIQAKGEMSARELIQLTSAGVPALEILRNELHNQSISWDNISDSAYSADQIIKALYSGMEKNYGGLSAKIQLSMAGIIETLVSEWKEFWRSVMMDSGVLTQLETMGNKLVAVITRLRESGQLKEWTDLIGIKLVNALKTVEKIVIYIAGHWKDWKDEFTLLLIPVKAFIAYQLAAVMTEIAYGAIKAIENVGNLAKAFTTLNTVTKGLSLGAKGGLVGLALFGGVELGGWLRKNFAIVNEFGIGLMGGLHKTFTHTASFIQDVIYGIKYIFVSMFKELQNSMNNFLEYIEKAHRALASTKIGKKLGLDANVQYVRFQGGYFENYLKEMELERQQRKGREQADLEEIDRIYTEMMAESMAGILTTTTTKPSKTTKPHKISTLPSDDKPKIDDKWKKQEDEDLIKQLKKYDDAFAEGLGANDKAYQEWFLAQQEKWTDFNKQVSDGFVNVFADVLEHGITNFGDFCNNLWKSFKGLLAKMAAEELFGGVARSLAKSITDPIKSSLTSLIQTSLGKSMGMGGEGMALGGAALGMFAIGGIALGGILNNVFKKKKKAQTYSIPVELDFSVNEADFSSLLDKTFAKIPEQLGAMVNSVKSQISKMYGMDYLYKFDPAAEMQKFIYTLQGTIFQISSQILSTPRRIVEMNLQEIKSWFPQYNEELLNQIKELEDKLAYETSTSRAIDVAGFGAVKYILNMQQMLEPQIETLNEQLAEGVEGLIEKVKVFGQTFSEVIGNAFNDSLGSFDIFKENISKGLYEAFRESFLNAINDAMMQQTFKKVWDIYGIGGFDELAAGLVGGTKSKEDITAIIGSMVTVMEDVRPLFEQMNEALVYLDTTLSYNTDAILTNTDALTAQQQINDFIAQLTTGTLAPVQSMEAITDRYNQLLGSGDLNDLFSYVSGTMLPFFQSFGGDYQTAFTGVVSDLQGLASSYGSGFSPSSIGDAVASAIAPILQGTQTIHVTIEVDGTQIGEVLIDQLASNPQLVEAIQQV